MMWLEDRYESINNEVDYDNSVDSSLEQLADES